MARDIVFGARQLRRQPAFAVTAIASLALGIGLTTTLFHCTPSSTMLPSSSVPGMRLANG
jgi:hypothetical protein